MLQKIFATGLAFFCLSTASHAQDAAPAADTTTVASAPALVFSGSADAYYRYDFGEMAANNKTSFTNSHNSFELGMISLKAEHSIGKVGMVADVGFGKRAEDFSYADDNTRFIIKQLYLSYAFKNGLKITTGSWATHVGYELVDAYANRNYSMSYMFSYGPFFHTGIKAEKTFGKTGLMLGIANPTDLKSTTLSNKYIIGQLSTATKDDVFKAYLNYQGGKPTDSVLVNQLDLVVLAALGGKFSLGLNGTISNVQFKSGTEGDFGDGLQWFGAAIYLNADLSEHFWLTLRTEYFDDAKQLNVFGAAPAGGNVLAATLSANFKVEGLTVIPEIRFEKASEQIFLNTPDKPTDTSASFLVAAVYKF